MACGVRKIAGFMRAEGRTKVFNVPNRATVSSTTFATLSSCLGT